MAIARLPVDPAALTHQATDATPMLHTRRDPANVPGMTMAAAFAEDRDCSAVPRRPWAISEHLASCVQRAHKIAGKRGTGTLVALLCVGSLMAQTRDLLRGVLQSPGGDLPFLFTAIHGPYQLLHGDHVQLLAAVVHRVNVTCNGIEAISTK